MPCLWKRAAPQKAFGKGHQSHQSKTRAFGKGLHHKKPLEKGTKAKQEPLEKGPKPLRKGFKTFGKEFQSSFTSRTFGKGFKTFGKEFEFSFTSKVYRNQQAHKWPAGKNNQLMKNSENEI